MDGMKRALFLLVLGGAVPAAAVDRYVATTGSDSNPGTSAQPWRTLQHAVDAIAPGDVILVRAGTYVGVRIEDNSGTAAAPKTLMAEPGARPLINAPSPQDSHNSLIEVEDSSYWVIDGFEAANAPQSGIDIRVTDHITVRNCVVYGSDPAGRHSGIFLAFSDFPVIENNESFNNSEHGVYHSNSGDHPVIRGNRFHHNGGCGIHVNGDFSMGGDGIVSFGVFEDNVIYENGTIFGGSGLNFDGGSDGIIRNNLLYNNHAGGISLYANDGGEGSSRNLVYNNTIVMHPDGRWNINIPANETFDGAVRPEPTGNKIKNNVLYHANANRGSFTVYGRAVAGFESDYNVVMNRFTADDGSSTMSLAAWRALGYDAHSITSTPAALFVDPANDDYRLRAGSPAIDAGTTLAEAADDREGQPRSVPYDIGADELDGPADTLAPGRPRGLRFQ
jgi:parallel beta-helix repeat protein